MQSDVNWEKVEALVRSYEHSIFAQPSRKTKDDGKIPAANMAFTKKTRGKNIMTKRCRICNKPGHLAKGCWQGSKGPAGKKVSKSHAERPGSSGSGGKDNRTCFVCGKVGHIAKECYHRVDKSTQEDDNTKKGKFNSSGDGGGKSQWYKKGAKCIRIATQRMRIVM